MTPEAPLPPLDDVTVRPEQVTDHHVIDRIHTAAFARDIEARLVRRLRDGEDSYLGLVAELAGEPIGHIVFTAVVIDPADAVDVRFAALGPMAVLPDFQRRGVGRILIRHGLDACREAGYGGVVVLGYPEYYPRFGFHRASRFGLCADFDVPEDVFMAMKIGEADIRTNAEGGVVRYAEPFHQL